MSAPSPINTLPAELLVEIFVVTADCDLPSARALGWVRIGHVCRRWRDTLVQVHKLWARIPAAFPCSDTAHRVILERAHGAPLTFWPAGWRAASPAFVDADRFLSEDVREVARHNIHRTAALAHADARDAEDEDWAALLAGRTLPHLRALELVSGAPNSRPDFSAFAAPKLRSLVFENVFVRFTAPALRSLTLSADGDARHSISLDVLLDALEPCADLAELDLSRAVRVGPVPPHRLASLHRLTTLRFRGAEDAFSSLWAHLDIPACEYLHLALPFAAHSLSTIPLIRPLLQHPAHDTLQISLSPLSLPTVSFELHVGASSTFHRPFSGRSTGRGVSLLIEHKARAHYDHEPRLADTTRTAALAALVAQLHAPRIRVLNLSDAHLSVVGLDRADPLGPALAPLTNIGTVVLCPAGSGDCFGHLARLARAPPGAPPPFPALARIAFQHPSARARPAQLPPAAAWLAQHAAPLRAYLAARRAAGAPLAHISPHPDQTPGRELEAFCAAVAREAAGLLAEPPRRAWPLFSLALARPASTLLRRPARMYPRAAGAAVVAVG